MVSKSIEDSLKDHSTPERSSVPYIRVLVNAFCRSKQANDRDAKVAELTVWRVSEEHLHLLKEGTVVRMKNLGVKSDRGGLLQLSANADTQIESLPVEPTQHQLIQSGYVERSPKSLIRINLMSKKLDSSRLAREVDVVACILKIHRHSENTSEAWLTDESGFILKLTRNHSTQNIDPFHLGNADIPAAVAFCNIQVESFDANDQCARGVWSLSSCKAGHLMRLRCDELQSWCSSLSGLESCNATLARIHAGIPKCSCGGASKLCIGYILGIYIHDANSVGVLIDWGEETPVTARLPPHHLSEALLLCHNSSASSGGIDAITLGQHLFEYDNLQRTLPLLGEYFRNNQALLQFTLEMPVSYGEESPLPAVTKVSLASADALSRLHLDNSEQES